MMKTDRIVRHLVVFLVTLGMMFGFGLLHQAEAAKYNLKFQMARHTTSGIQGLPAIHQDDHRRDRSRVRGPDHHHDDADQLVLFAISYFCLKNSGNSRGNFLDMQGPFPYGRIVPNTCSCPTETERPHCWKGRTNKEGRRNRMRLSPCLDIRQGSCS